MYMLSMFSICLGESCLEIQGMFFLGLKVKQMPPLKHRMAPFSMESS